MTGQSSSEKRVDDLEGRLSAFSTGLASVEQRVDELEVRVAELEEEIEDGSVTRTVSDIETFVDSVSPETHVERATTFGYFLVHEEEENPFTVDLVEGLYERCRLPKPANLSDVLAGAEDRGLVTRSGTQGRKQLWTVTPDGDKAVEGGFD